MFEMLAHATLVTAHKIVRSFPYTHIYLWTFPKYKGSLFFIIVLNAVFNCRDFIFIEGIKTWKFRFGFFFTLEQRSKGLIEFVDVMVHLSFRKDGPKSFKWLCSNAMIDTS